MIIETKFNEGDSVVYLQFGEVEKDTIKSIEVRTMNNVTYIKYMTKQGFWKNEQELFKNIEELKEVLK